MVDSLVALAEMMVNGRGGERDHYEAARLFKKAAELGHGGAMFGLGALYGGGHDLPIDRPLALRWFRDAAERGHPQAQLMLGRYLRLGLASPADPDQARLWLQRAIESGVPEAAADIAAIDAERGPLPGASAGISSAAPAGAKMTRETGPQLIHN
jgi:hypothetical protein